MIYVRVTISKTGTKSCEGIEQIHTCVQGTASKGLEFVPLDLNTVHVCTFIDASFARNPDYSSQLGYIICLADASGACNIVHYASKKCKRVTRSVLAAELYAMVLGYDYSYVIHKCLCHILARKVSLKLLTDSRCLFDALTTLNQTKEKRLLIDISMLRQDYENRSTSEVLWIPGSENPAGGLTKPGKCNALLRLMNENRIELNPKVWIDRSSKSLRPNNSHCKHHNSND